MKNLRLLGGLGLALVLARTALGQQADLSITKTANATNVSVGTLVTFSITVSNAGPTAVTDVKVPELLGPGWSFSGEFSSGNAMFFSSSNTWNIFDLASHGTEVLTLQAFAGTPGLLTNGVAVLPVSGVTDPNLNNNTAFANVSVTATNDAADLLVRQTASATNVVIGDLVTFSITVSNAGPSDTSDVKVPDVLGPGWNFSGAFNSGNAVFHSASNTWNIFGLPSGESEVLTLQAVAVTPGSLSNSVSVLPLVGLPDPNTNDNHAVVAVSVADTNSVADVQVTKSASTTNTPLGTLVTFSLTVSNAGPSDINNVKVADQLGSGWTFVAAFSSGNATFYGSSNTWNIFGLAGGSAEMLTLQAYASTPGVQTNTAVALPVPGFNDPNLGNNTAMVLVNVVATNDAADLQVSQTIVPPTVLLGGQGTFSITVSNAGPADVSNVKVVDVLGAGWAFNAAFSSGNAMYFAASNTWNIFGLPAGSSEVLTLQASAAAPGDLTNTARALPVFGITDPNPGNNTAAIVLSVASTNDAADLRIMQSADATNVPVGTLVTFSITVSNAGPSDASDVKVSDVLGAGWTFSEAFSSGNAIFYAASNTWNVFGLPSGAAETLTLQAHAAAPGAQTNAAIVFPVVGIIDPDLSNNIVAAVVNVAATNGAADLQITQVMSPTNVALGDLATFSITVSNAGPADVSDVKVVDVLSGGWTFSGAFSSGNAVFHSASNTWNIFGLPAGSSEVLTLQAVASNSGLLVNLVTVLPSLDVPDLVTNNNFASIAFSIPGTNQTVSLAIRVEGNNAVLSWPAAETGWLVEAKGTVVGDWASVTNAPVVVGSEWNVTLPATAESRFFRLRKQ